MRKALLTLSVLAAFAFAAAAQDTIQTFTFSNDDMSSITTGTLGPGDIVNGETITTDNAHGDGGWGWNRYSDSAYFFASGINVYTQSGQYYVNMAEYFGGNYLGTDDGFMLMAMMEVTGNYPMNAYFQLPAVARPESTQVVAVHMTQLYVKFNNDHCWIDYKVNNQWKSREINVKGVDCITNNYANVKPQYTMPLELAQQDMIELRVRWACNDKAGGAYGWFWMVDNLAVVSAPATNWQHSGSDVYVDGLYGTVPQGWQLPLTWYADVKNTGANDIANLTATVYSQPLDGSGDVATVATTSLANLEAGDMEGTTRMTIDGRQLYSENYWSPSFFYTADGYANPYATITNSGLTTNEAGWYSAYATVGVPGNTALGTYYYNPHSYRVSDVDDDGGYRWSLSRGILSSADQGYRHGYHYVNGYTYIVAEDEYWTSTNYGMMTRLTTPNVIPVDDEGQPWVLRGIELVAAPNLAAEGAELQPIIYKVDAYANYISIMTGASNHIVTSDELNTLESGVLMPGQYNTIRINFPNPVVLEPATSYYIGFQKKNDSEFAVARDYNRFYAEDGSLTQFIVDDSLAAYADLVDVGAAGIYIFSPSGGGYIGSVYSEAPMISGVVGPMPDIPMHDITISHNGGAVYQQDGVTRIYATDSTPLQYGEGSIVSFYFTTYADSINAAAAGVAADAMQLKQLFINGMEVSIDENYYGDDYQLERVNMEGADAVYYHELTFFNVTSDVNVQAVFGPYESDGSECQPVTSWEVTNIDSTTATLYWYAPLGSSDMFYISFEGSLISVPGTAYTLTGLSSGTTYSNVYIVYQCANGDMIYSDEISFTTESAPAFTEYNTFTVTKNGNGYLYYSLQSGDDNGSMIMGSGTTTYSVGDGDMVTYEAATFDPSRLSDLFGGTDVIGMGYLDADALTVQSIYLDGQMLDISTENYDEVNQDGSSYEYTKYGSNYTLVILDYYVQYGYYIYIVEVNSDGDHQLVFNYGEGETPESYYVSFSSNNPALGEVISNVGNGSYTEGTQIESYAIVQGGVTFVGWAIDNDTNIVSQSNPLQMGVDTNMNIIGVFTTASVVTVPVHDTLYIGGTDTVYLYSIDTVYRYLTDTVYLIDTVYMGGTDTVYITDTVYVGVDDVEPGAEVKLYSQNSQIVVEGAQGHDVVLYDAVGRRLAARRDDYGLVRFEVPASGVYLVRVGQKPARRIVVVK